MHVLSIDRPATAGKTRLRAPLYGLGCLLLLGMATGCSHSPETMASSRGHEYQFELAERYQTGNGVERDMAKAIYWYEQASVSAPWGGRGKTGNNNALQKLAKIYSDGDGVPVDYQRSVYWHNRVIEKTGSHWSMHAIAGLYNTGGPGLPKNTNLAAAWYRKAADEGNHWAQYQLGEAYRKGDGVGQDAGKAGYWYEMAALQGNDWAQLQLSKSLRAGDGKPKNVAAANEWLRKSAEQGNDWASLALGDVLRLGKGVDKDVEQSIAWYQRAADKGNKQAQDRLVELGYNHVSDVTTSFVSHEVPQ